jgi:hypothetical protein
VAASIMPVAYSAPEQVRNALQSCIAVSQGRLHRSRTHERILAIVGTYLKYVMIDSAVDEKPVAAAKQGQGIGLTGITA